ncbi:acyl carrier protein [Streptomyces sp. ISL-112]|nr:acyl carrier protein [Streptomyces sp. ISL-112]MBT2462282.1 acyl carrier protein [Streptomyces sp. ISL-63]
MSPTEPSLEDIVTVVVEFLAELQDRDPDELRMELEEASEELPVDSILIVEILTRIEERYGISVPADEEAARSTRSVYTFATTVLNVIKER